MKVTVELRPRRTEDKVKHVTAVDNNTIIVSMSPAKPLQFISVKPALTFGQEIHMKCDCDGIVCYKKELYVYSHCLDELAVFRYEGFKILSIKGKVLKTIPLFDNITCFSLNKQGNIVYFGSRQINDSKESFMKCVTREGTIISQSPYPKSVPPVAIILDEEGNVIVCDVSSYCNSVEVIKEDGKIKKRLILAESYWRTLTSLCYNKHDNSLLVVGRESDDRTMHYVRIYKIEF